TTNILNLDYTGFAGTSANTTKVIYGNLTLGSGMTWTAGSNTTFAATSGTKTITSNGIIMATNSIFDGVGGTWQLGDALNLSTATLTLTNGTFDANEKNV